MDSEYSLIFVPSKKDITEYAGADSYWCGLAEVHHEINFLLSEIAKVFFAAPLNEKKRYSISMPAKSGTKVQ